MCSVGTMKVRCLAFMTLVVAFTFQAACGYAPGHQRQFGEAASSSRTTPSASTCAAQPEARQSEAFVYIPDRQQALLFGGWRAQIGYVNDSWSWNAGCWTRLAPANNPPPMAAPVLAYDAGRATVVLWGQRIGPNGAVAETWTWNGQDWIKSTATGPEGVAVAAYDANINRVVLFESSISETWIWDGSQWQKSSPAHKPGSRFGTSMAFDPVTKSLLLFGGFVRTPVQRLSDTWLWNGSDWAQVTPKVSPSARAQATMVSFTRGKQVLLLGGENAPTVLTDAWAWDGTTWAPMASYGISGGAVAVDAGSQVVVFGGWSDGKLASVTRVWDGASWVTQ